jgi:hypothetical protein
MRFIASEAFMIDRGSMLVCGVGVPLAVVGGCAITEEAGATDKSGAKATTAVPANCRQLLASRILESTDRQKIRRAQEVLRVRCPNRSSLVPEIYRRIHGDIAIRPVRTVPCRRG